MSLRLDSVRTVAAVSVCMLSLLITGCAGSGVANSVGPSNPIVASGTSTLSGKTHGGFNFIGGATVTLYAMGSAYGSATPVAHTTSSAADGSFSFTQSGTTQANDNSSSTYSCPGSSSQMYLVSAGGNTTGHTGTGTNNVASVLMAAIGPCSTDGQVYITINEATTVAAIFAMQQFVNVSADSSGAVTNNILIGAPSTLSNGLANAYQTVLNLVNPTSGTFHTSFSPVGSVAGVTMTGTPESAKLVTIANILSACVNQGSYDNTATASACYQLLHTAVPPSVATTNQGASTTAALDVAMAAYYLATNPTQAQDGVTTRNATLYGLSTGYAPFGPGLGAAPTDWTVAITYSAGSSTCASANAESPFNYPTQVAIDLTGNLWVTNGASAGINAVAEITPAGAVATCLDGTFAGGNSILVDKNNNVWYTATGSSAPGALYEYKGSGSPVSWTIPSASQPYSLASDKTGDIIMTSAVTPFTPQIYVDAADAGSVSAPIAGSATGASSAAATLAVTNYPSYSTTPYLFAAGPSSLFAYSPPGASGFVATESTYGETISSGGVIATDDGGMIAGANQAGGSSPAASFFKVSPGSTTAGFSSQFAGGLNSAGGLAVDGINNYWSALALPVATGVYGFAEVTGANFTALSPAGASISCTSTACITGGGFQRANVSGALTGTAIDASGNVWAAINSGSAGAVGTLSSNGLVEVVGAAAPVVTPLVTGTLSFANTGGASAPVVAITAPSALPASVAAGATLSLTATVSNDQNNAGVTWTATAASGSTCSGSSCGTFSNVTTTSATYIPPTSLTSNLQVVITATSNAVTSSSASVNVADTSTIALSPTLLPGAIVGQPYSANVTISGGTAPYILSAAGFQSWVSAAVSGNTITISGTPTGSATYTTSGTATPPFAYATTATLGTGTSVGSVSIMDSTPGTALTGTASTALSAYNPSAPTTAVATTATYTTTANTLLSGTYAFYATGFQNAASIAAGYPLRVGYIGSFYADGNGNITKGEVDINSGTGIVHYPLTGTYAAQTNQVAAITLLLPTSPVTQITLMASLSSVTPSPAVTPVTSTSNSIAAYGQFIQYDDASGVGTTAGTTGNRLSGEFSLQSPAVLSAGTTPISGPYVFGTQGGTPAATLTSACEALGTQTCGPASTAGSVTFTSAAVTAGEEDAVYGSITAPLSTLSGRLNNSGATDAYGRVTGLITPATLPRSDWPENYAIYVVDANHFYFMSIDSFATNTMLSGRAQTQMTANVQSTPFSAGPLVLFGSAYGNYSVYTPSSGGDLDVLFLMTPTSASTTTGTLALTNGSFNGATSKSSSEAYTNLVTTSTSTGANPFSYTVDPVYGRVTLSGGAFFNAATSKPNLLGDPVLYMIDTNTGVAITQPTPNSATPTATSVNPTGIYFFLPQSSTTLNAGVYATSIFKNVIPEGVTQISTFNVPSAITNTTATALTGQLFDSFNKALNESNAAGGYLFDQYLPGGTSNSGSNIALKSSTTPTTLALFLPGGNEACANGLGLVVSATSFVCMPSGGQVFQQIMYATQ